MNVSGYGHTPPKFGMARTWFTEPDESIHNAGKRAAEASGKDTAYHVRVNKIHRNDVYVASPDGETRKVKSNQVTADQRKQAKDFKPSKH